MTTFSIIDAEITETSIAGLLVLRMKQVTDDRGTVREFFRASAFREAGVEIRPWQQVNVTETRPGAVRGLHGEAMTKLVAVASGSAFGVYVDTRDGSASRGTVETVSLEPGVQVLVPAGVCNGFQSTGTAPSQYVYCFDDEWRPGMAGVALTPLDPALGISWPLPVDRTDPAQLSAKDAAAPTLEQLLRG